MLPNKTEVTAGAVYTSRSERAVMLIVEEKPSNAALESLRGRRDHRGAFLTAVQARKVAAELVRYADEADAIKDPTPKEKEAILARLRSWFEQP